MHPPPPPASSPVSAVLPWLIHLQPAGEGGGLTPTAQGTIGPYKYDIKEWICRSNKVKTETEAVAACR